VPGRSTRDAVHSASAITRSIRGWAARGIDERSKAAEVGTLPAPLLLGDNAEGRQGVGAVRRTE